MQLGPGSTLGGYRITAQIGQGGMGEVYRAHDARLDRDVAIKVLPKLFVADAERVARFEREARTLASLNDPHIAQIYGIEDAGGGVMALVLELVEGPTLAERIAQGPIPAEDTLSMALQIAGALETAHEQGIVHRDLKPANIKLRPDGTVKVLDFGLAKALDPVSSPGVAAGLPTITTPAMTHAGVILGTAADMSPEQAKGKAVDKRADIWAFGCVLYEMLTGRSTFSGDTVPETLAEVLKSTPAWDGFPAGAPPGMQRLVQRCLQKDPRQRIRDIGDVRLELERLQSSPLEIAPSATAPPAPRRHVVIWTTAAAAAAAIAGAAVMWLIGRAPQPPLRVARYSYVLPDDQGFRNLGRSVLSLSPDGRGFVYNAGQGLYYRPLEELTARLVPGLTGGLTEPVFSPNGQWIAHYSGGELKKISLNGGAPVPLCPAGNPYGMSWADDDTILFGQSEGVMRVPARGGKPELIVRAGQGESVDGPQLLPGGRLVLFSSTHTEGPNRWDVAEIVVQDLETGARTVVFKGGSGARYVPTGHLVYATGTTVFAVPFDVKRLSVQGGPVSILENVQRGIIPSTNTSAANYQFSRDGTLAYVVNTDTTGQSARTLTLVDRLGVATPINVPPAPYVNPRISPDGRTLAVETATDGPSVISVFDLAGTSAIRRLALGGRPTWTPDSRHVTFASTQDGKPGIFWQLADGSAPAERVTTAEPGTTELPESWSPDARILSFARIRGGNSWGLWTISRDPGSKPVLLEDRPDTNEFGSVLSPDGKWIVHGTSAEGFKIFVQPFPATGAKYEVASNGAVWPLWSHDGRELFFRLSTLAVNPNEGQRLNVFNISTSPTFSFSNQKTLPIGNFLAFLGYRDFDITPDGKRFVVIRPAQGPRPTDRVRSEIHIVEHWFEELKQRVPVR